MRELGRCLVFLLITLLGRHAFAGERVVRFALVIGNNQPEAAGSAHLRYADDDAILAHRLFEDAGVRSALLVTPDSDTRALYPALVPSGRPTLSDLQRVFSDWSTRLREAARAGARTELFVVYSGHGDVDRGEGYVVFEDGRLTRSLLYELLTDSGAAQNHVFVDACKSYFLAFEKGPGGRRSPYAGALFGSVPAGLENTGFVLSTSSDRDSHEWERYQAGILSHELRSALRGAADANLDGQVTYAELAAFLTVANRAIPNARFRPDFLVRPPARGLGGVVLGYARASASIRLAPSGLGHVYVESAQGIRLADVPASRGQAVVLYGISERPLFVRRHDETAESVISGPELADVSELAFGPVEIASRGALHLAFERLFAAPFGPSDVRDFEVAQSGSAGDRSPGVSYDDAAGARTSGSALSTASGVIALGALAGGLTLNTLAAVNYFQSDGESQAELEKSNSRTRTLNLASLACYAVAAGAGVTWLLTRPRAEPRTQVSLLVGGRSGTNGVEFRGRF